MRHEGLLKDIIEGKMDGKRRKGRPRLGMMSEMGDYSKLKRNAEDRRKWYTMARTFNYVWRALQQLKSWFQMGLISLELSDMTGMTDRNDLQCFFGLNSFPNILYLLLNKL